MVRSKDLGKDVSQVEDLVVGWVAIESQNKIIGCLIAPMATNDLGG